MSDSIQHSARGVSHSTLCSTAGISLLHRVLRGYLLHTQLYVTYVLYYHSAPSRVVPSLFLQASLPRDLLNSAIQGTLPCCAQRSARILPTPDTAALNVRPALPTLHTATHRIHPAAHAAVPGRTSCSTLLHGLHFLPRLPSAQGCCPSEHTTLLG